MSSQGKRWRLLRHKAEYLRLDLEGKEEQLSAWEAILSNQIDQLVVVDEVDTSSTIESASLVPSGSSPINQPDARVESSASEHFSETESEETPHYLRKLWHAIAIATHPDKTGNDPDLTKLYQRASQARSDVDVLLDIAIACNIPIDETDVELLDALEKKTLALEVSIKKMTSSIVWAWGVSDDAGKEKIKERLVAARKGRLRARRT